PIPAHAPLSADPQLHPHLAHRPDAYRFPNVGENAEWVLVDVTTNSTQHPADLRRDLLALLDKGWGIAEARDGYLLLKRGATEKQLPREFFWFARLGAPPTIAFHARLGDLIEVFGYDVVQDFWGRVIVRWHLRPTTALPPTLVLATALLDGEGTPLPDTVAQPTSLLTWLPVEQWEVGHVYVVQTLPREATPTFWPTLSATLEGTPLPLTVLNGSGGPPAPVRLEQVGAWLHAGAWKLENNHARRAEEGWRRWASPVAEAKEPGNWTIAHLGAWEITRVGGEERLQVMLHWRASGSGMPPVQRFLHLVPAEGAPVPLAQVDSPLGTPEYPNSHWLEGEWISEPLTLSIPPGAPDRMRLLVGLYDPESGQRFPLLSPSGDSLELGIVLTQD
ncbi:MAG: hypothetical protein H0T73_18345, partial [Ardenticatenales bacterium]|nr:hypothetical protein [Ardenticatenales bacterium]